jgi:hypothetical protein
LLLLPSLLAVKKKKLLLLPLPPLLLLPHLLLTHLLLPQLLLLLLTLPQPSNSLLKQKKATFGWLFFGRHLIASAHLWVRRPLRWDGLRLDVAI